MSDPTDPVPARFRAELDQGVVLEADGSTLRDSRSGELRPAVVVRMPAARAHELAGVLGAWSQASALFDRRMPPLTTELPLARALDAAAAALGDRAALRAADAVSGAVPTPRRLAAAEVLRAREERLSALQRLAVVDAAAWWLGQEAGDQLAWALLEAVCINSTTISYVYLALIASSEDPAPAGGHAGG